METIKVQTTCPRCKMFSYLEVESDQYYSWREGKQHIQDALPTLTAIQREKLITGICGSCWEEIFKEVEE